MFKNIFKFKNKILFTGLYTYLYNEFQIKNKFFCNSFEKIYDYNKDYIFTLKLKNEIISNAVLFKSNLIFGYIPSKSLNIFNNELKNDIIIEEAFSGRFLNGKVKFFDNNSGFFIIEINKNLENKNLNFEKNNIGEELLCLGKDSKNTNYLKKIIISESNLNKQEFPFIIDKINDNSLNDDIFLPIFKKNGSFRGYLNPNHNYIVDPIHISNLVSRYSTFNKIEKPLLGLTLSEDIDGLNIMRISNNSIFKEYDLNIGDRITHINRQKIEYNQQLKNIIGYSLNKEFEFTFIKSNYEEIKINVKI